MIFENIKENQPKTSPSIAQYLLIKKRKIKKQTCRDLKWFCKD